MNKTELSKFIERDERGNFTYHAADYAKTVKGSERNMFHVLVWQPEFDQVTGQYAGTEPHIAQFEKRDIAARLDYLEKCTKTQTRVLFDPDEDYTAEKAAVVEVDGDELREVKEGEQKPVRRRVSK